MQRAQLGEDCIIDDAATIGYDYDRIGAPTIIGADARIRSGTVVYADVTVGDRLRTGHNALLREGTTIGDDVLVGTEATVDGQCDIGSNVSLQTRAYVPAKTIIDDHVFLGPSAVLTNDPVPVRDDDDSRIVGPTLKRGVTIGANATVLPDVTVGTDAFVAAGAVVTRDVPRDTLAVGVPATHQELPRRLTGGNVIG